MADTCDLCPASVVWVRVPSGRRIPLETDDGGQAKAFADTPGRGRIQKHPSYRGGTVCVDELIVHVLPEAGTPDPELPIWRSHYAVSCRVVAAEAEAAEVMATCSQCHTKITTLRDRAPNDRTWLHLEDGHDDHEPAPTRSEGRR